MIIYFRKIAHVKKLTMLSAAVTRTENVVHQLKSSFMPKHLRERYFNTSITSEETEAFKTYVYLDLTNPHPYYSNYVYIQHVEGKLDMYPIDISLHSRLVEVLNRGRINKASRMSGHE